MILQIVQLKLAELEQDIAKLQNYNKGNYMTITIPIPFLTLVEDEDRDARYTICKACDKFTKFKTCSECNCIMPVKVVWTDSECPLGKWSKISI
jgi:hypothetical protein